MPAKMLLFDVAIFIAVIICGNYCVYAGDLNITASTFSNLKAGDIGAITLDFEASSVLPHDGKLLLTVVMDGTNFLMVIEGDPFMVSSGSVVGK